MKFKNKKNNTIYIVTTPSLIDRFKNDSDYELVVTQKAFKKKDPKVESQTIAMNQKTKNIE